MLERYKYAIQTRALYKTVNNARKKKKREQK